MKKILIILLVIYSQCLFAQIDERKINIVPKDYYLYEFSKKDTNDETYDESDSLYVDSVLIDIVEISYPYI